LEISSVDRSSRSSTCCSKVSRLDRCHIQRRRKRSSRLRRSESPLRCQLLQPALPFPVHPQLLAIQNTQTASSEISWLKSLSRLERRCTQGRMEYGNAIVSLMIWRAQYLLTRLAKTLPRNLRYEICTPEPAGPCRAYLSGARANHGYDTRLGCRQSLLSSLQTARQAKRQNHLTST
jgi:hypothetical protein